jgi:hypothetical protein
MFIVRRGALRRFDRLKRAARELPVDVIWDRRRSAEGLTSSAADTYPNRRQQPSFTWGTADFVVVEKDEEEGLVE